MSLPVPFIDVRVHHKQSGTSPLSLELIAAESYQLDAHGNLTLLDPIELGSHGRVTFFFDPGSTGASFLGLKIARDHAGLQSAAILFDTQDSFHADTPFKVSPGQVGPDLTLELSTWPTYEAPDPLGHEGWYYTVGLQVPGLGPVWLDPRLHNKGEGDPPTRR